MNNYCIHIKKRKNKPYCTVLNREISLSECNGCGNKEYRFPVKGKIAKNAQKNKNIVHKSKKIAKLERNRKSVFTNDLEH